MGVEEKRSAQRASDHDVRRVFVVGHLRDGAKQPHAIRSQHSVQPLGDLLPPKKGEGEGLCVKNISLPIRRGACFEAGYLRAALNAKLLVSALRSLHKRLKAAAAGHVVQEVKV
jgi:hypothetical protein